MKQKLILAISFIALAQLLPLSGKPELILQYKNIAIMFAVFGVWATQPPISKKETVENKNRDKFSVLLIIIMSILSVAVAIIDWAYFRNAHDNLLLSIIGLFIIATGIIFRIWAIHTLGKQFTPTVQIKEDQKLVTSGPYSVVRHPSYLGAMWAMVGTSVFLNSIIGTIISFVCMFYAYYTRIATEEQALSELFGKKYSEYQKKVKKLIPFIW
ncbi:MAG TPA: isoprenylcysteine carboxylmethyltransferase family protein [Chitinophagaceae bacterium]|jgi:protein-S-isoprenylcysteine O-methyltransferase Ste14